MFVFKGIILEGHRRKKDRKNKGLIKILCLYMTIVYNFLYHGPNACDGFFEQKINAVVAITSR